MKQYLKSVPALLALATTLIAPLAFAGQRVMPSSGHPFDDSHASGLRSFDSKVCSKGSSSWHVWNTPLVLDTSESSVGVYQTRATSGGAQSRLVSFNSNGSVNSFSGSYTSNNYVGTVSIPGSGTVFIQSRLNFSSQTLVDGCISSFRAYPS